jgi:hypothetical protein
MAAALALGSLPSVALSSKAVEPIYGRTKRPRRKKIVRAGKIKVDGSAFHG